MSLPGGLEVRDRPPRGGGVLLVLGAIVLLAGIGALVHGIVETVRQATSLREDAVAQGTVSFGPGESVAFESPERGVALYLDFDGRSNFSDVRENTVAATVCEVSSTDGKTTTFRGSRQGTSLVIGDLASVGSLDLRTAAGRIGCTYDRMRGSLTRPQDLPWILTPHKTSEGTGSILLIIGGVMIGGLGGWAAVAGVLRLRRRARLRSL